MKSSTTSIVTSMYNCGKEALDVVDQLFIPGVLGNASSSTELIFIDDCSPLMRETRAIFDRYKPLLEERFGNVIFARNQENYGFGKSFNRGAELANGKNLLMVNDDVYLTRGSVRGLIDTLGTNCCVAAGPISTQRLGGTYQFCSQAPCINSYDQKELEVIERYAERIKVMLKGLRVETDFIQGFCFALDREQFKELGGFDTLFLHGYYEDNDLMNRLSQKGKLIINPEVFVYHGSVKGASVSFRQIHLKSINALIRNSAIYAKKWGVSALIQRQIDLITHAIGFNTVSEVINEKETSI